MLGIDWLDPEFLLDKFGAEFFWISLLIIFVECGLLFPFLPGDSLLFAMGIFIATDQIDLFPGVPLVELLIAMVIMTAAAWSGNVVGYELGRGVGAGLRDHDGRILKKKHLDNTAEFFDRHGNRALVIGRFVAFVRTYITLVAGVSRMERRRFYFWSFVGGVAWVISITSVGYFLGRRVPWLQDNVDLAVLAIVAFTLVPIVYEWWKHRRQHKREAAEAAAASSDGSAGTTATTADEGVTTGPGPAAP
jgi:membrane-associated protein